MRALPFALLLLSAGCAHLPVPVDLDNPETAAAWHTFTRRCQSCHALPDLRTMTRARWEPALVKMETKVHLAPEVWASLRELVPIDSARAVRTPAGSDSKQTGGMPLE